MGGGGADDRNDNVRICNRRCVTAVVSPSLFGWHRLHRAQAPWFVSAVVSKHHRNNMSRVGFLPRHVPAGRLPRGVDDVRVSSGIAEEAPFDSLVDTDPFS